MLSPALAPGQCSHPPAVEHADLQHRHEFLVGTTLTYSCRVGFSLIPGVSPTITCLQNFTWSSVPRLCQSECNTCFALPTKHRFNNTVLKPPLVLLGQQGFVEQLWLSLAIISLLKGWRGWKGKAAAPPGYLAAQTRIQECSRDMPSLQHNLQLITGLSHPSAFQKGWLLSCNYHP